MRLMSPRDKPLVWLRGEVKTPPFGSDARVEAGFLLRRLQRGEKLSMPHSRPMPGIGAACHELRIIDGSVAWRIHIAPDAIVILDVFAKKTAVTPKSVIVRCRKRLAEVPTRSGRGERSGPCASISVASLHEPGGPSGMPVTSWACPPTSGASSKSSSHWRTGCAVDGRTSD